MTDSIIPPYVASQIRSAERLRIVVSLLRAVQDDLGRDAVDTAAILDLERLQLDLEEQRP